MDLSKSSTDAKSSQITSPGGRLNGAAAKYDLAIAYRVCAKMSKAAFGAPFGNDKYRMTEVCLRSFRESLGSLRAKIWVLLDDCPPAYADLFREFFAAEDLILIPLQGAGNLPTFTKQIEILTAQSDAELVYFAEDDYFYLPGQFHLMTEFLQAYKDVDFVSPYDHLGAYTMDMHIRHPELLRVSGERHWRTVGAACLTFLTTQTTLLRAKRTFLTYGKGNSDGSLWLELTKVGLFNPATFVRWAIRQPFLARIVVKAWLYGLPQVLFGKRYKLWSPIPGLATHLAAGLLSPAVDWESLMRSQEPSCRLAEPVAEIKR